MPMVRAMRMLNAVEAGTLTGAQLQTLLTADPGRLAELNVLLGMRGQARRMAASSTAMTAVAASSTAMTAVAASSTAKMAVFNSDAALNAIAASATAMAAMRAASGYIVGTNTANGAAVTISGPNAAGSYIMLGYSKSNPSPQGISLFSTRRSGSTIASSAAAITNAGSTAGADVNIALPLVAPFQSAATNGIGYTWYFGMLRCDV